MTRTVFATELPSFGHGAPGPQLAKRVETDEFSKTPMSEDDSVIPDDGGPSGTSFQHALLAHVPLGVTGMIVSPLTEFPALAMTGVASVYVADGEPCSTDMPRNRRGFPAM